MTAYVFFMIFCSLIGVAEEESQYLAFLPFGGQSETKSRKKSQKRNKMKKRA